MLGELLRLRTNCTERPTQTSTHFRSHAHAFSLKLSTYNGQLSQSSPIGTINLPLRRLHRLHVPDHLRILVNAPIAAEEAHARHARDALGHPLVLILVRRVDQLVRLAVAVEVVRHEVVVAVVDDAVDEGGELAGVAEAAGLDGVKDFAQPVVQLVFAVKMVVAEVFDVFGKVAEEEDVGVANFASDFDLEKSRCQCHVNEKRYVGGIGERWDIRLLRHKYR